MKPIAFVVVFAVGIVTGQLIAQTKPDTALPAERISGIGLWEPKPGY